MTGERTGAKTGKVRIKHKGLRELAETDISAKVPANLAPRLRRILSMLASVSHPAQLADWPGLRAHPLRGNLRGFWAVRASGNWRVLFRFEDGEAIDIDLIDYH